MMKIVDSLSNDLLTLTRRAKPGKLNAPRPVYRDELDKKPRETNTEYKPLLPKDGVKVKILMTKAEAAQLLSRCKDGGVLEFKDVANQLVQIPTNRVNVVSITTSNQRQLKTITEEEEF